MQKIQRPIRVKKLIFELIQELTQSTLNTELQSIKEIISENSYVKYILNFILKLREDNKVYIIPNINVENYYYFQQSVIKKLGTSLQQGFKQFLEEIEILLIS